MKYQVIYFSKKGNTKKIAEAIASELGIEAEDVTDTKLKDNVFVFLGSGCYGGNPGKSMTKFIEDTTFNARTAALFGTSGSGDGVDVKEMENILKNKEACIKDTFFCKGKFLFTNRGRPNNQDIEEAKKFARRMIKEN